VLALLVQIKEAKVKAKIIFFIFLMFVL